MAVALRGMAACTLAALLSTGCLGYHGNHEIQSDSRSQIWMSEKSQVQTRNAQSRVFDTTDKRQMIQAIIATLQDLGFQLEVLDEKLGIISAKKFLDLERPHGADLITYLTYDEESLVVFNRSYRTWGPFERRSNLVRMTVTVRARNEQQLIVRAAAQFYLRAVDDPEDYQKFYLALEQSLFAACASGTR